MNDIKVGYGYDIHRLVKGKEIILAGVSLPSKKKILAHSDGDIILHSLSNAILSSIGENDIGFYFNENSIETLNIDSKKILSFALDKLKSASYKINNVVITLVTQETKIRPIRSQLVSSLSNLLSIESSNIAVHAGTKEKLDSVGKGKAIECYSLVLVSKRG